MRPAILASPSWSEGNSVSAKWIAYRLVDDAPREPRPAALHLCFRGIRSTTGASQGAYGQETKEPVALGPRPGEDRRRRDGPAQTKRLPGDPEKLLRAIAERKPARLPIRSEPNVIASLFASLDRGEDEPFPIPPDAEVLRRLVRFCHVETDLLTAQEASRYADALLALSAHRRDWVRPLDAWRARSHNARRQFASLLRHLIARYEVPAFLDAAWLAGLTPEAVEHQAWYKHIASGRNIRTAEDLPVPPFFLGHRDAAGVQCVFRRAGRGPGQRGQRSSGKSRMRRRRPG